MSAVTIFRPSEPVLAAALATHIDEIFENVRKRAFEKYLSRENDSGSELQDWLKAEQELLLTPAVDLSETKTGFELHADVAGFTADDVKVNVLPDSILIEAEKETKATEQEGQREELSSRKLFSRVQLPSAVEVDKVTAKMDRGTLIVTAPKASISQSEQKKVKVAKSS